MRFKILKKTLLWSLFNSVIVVLPLVLLPLFAKNGPDIDGVRFMLIVAGVGVLLGIILVVFPSALASELRLRRHPVPRLHYVPYLALVPHLIFTMGIAGMFFMPLVVLQLVVAAVLHWLMMRDYPRSDREI